MDPDDIRDDKNLTVTIGSTPPAPEYKYESDATYTISGESFAGGISTPSFTYSTEFAETSTIDSSFGLDIEMGNTIQSWPDEYRIKEMIEESALKLQYIKIFRGIQSCKDDFAGKSDNAF